MGFAILRFAQEEFIRAYRKFEFYSDIKVGLKFSSGINF